MPVSTGEEEEEEEKYVRDQQMAYLSSLRVLILKLSSGPYSFRPCFESCPVILRVILCDLTFNFQPIPRVGVHERERTRTEAKAALPPPLICVRY